MKITINDNKHGNFYVSSYTACILQIILQDNYEAYVRDTVLLFYKYILNSHRTRTQKTMTFKYKIPNSKLVLELFARLYHDEKDSVKICIVDTKILGIPKQSRRNLKQYIDDSLNNVLEETLLS